jgi:hypothetical protein
MRKMFLAVAATAALGTFGLVAPASAQTATAPVGELTAALQKGEVNADYAQYYRRGYGYRGGPRYVERRYVAPRRYGYYPRGYYRRDRGSNLAAGALGLATGAIIGGAIASSQAQAGNAASYCAQRYRSYDPASGTYLGNDGLRHACP